jgi:hypothetical protein
LGDGGFADPLSAATRPPVSRPTDVWSAAATVAPVNRTVSGATSPPRPVWRATAAAAELHDPIINVSATRDTVANRLLDPFAAQLILIESLP